MDASTTSICFHEYLARHVGPAALAVEVLKNHDATRANIIGRFRSHLAQAGSGDVALFQFCGHGARWASNAAFRESFPDGKDEGLVCSDAAAPVATTWRTRSSRS